jgi:hypothetical protein
VIRESREGVRPEQATIMKSTKRRSSSQLVRIGFKFVTCCESKRPPISWSFAKRKQAVDGTLDKNQGTRCGLNAFPRSVLKLQSLWAGLLA